MEEKKILRKEIKEKLQTISKPIYEHQSYLIAQTLQEDPYWKAANTIGITLSNFPEVDTYQLIRRAWEHGKRVVIPKCFPKERKMEFRQLKQFNQVESVYYGLFEPIESLTFSVKQQEIDLLIVPGLVFDKKGYRVGFGGGYYDRFLPTYNGHTISLCFYEQLVKSVPTESHDIPVEKIITNEGSIIVT